RRQRGKTGADRRGRVARRGGHEGGAALRPSGRQHREHRRGVAERGGAQRNRADDAVGRDDGGSMGSGSRDLQYATLRACSARGRRDSVRKAPPLLSSWLSATIVSGLSEAMILTSSAPNGPLTAMRALPAGISTGTLACTRLLVWNALGNSWVA